MIDARLNLLDGSDLGEEWVLFFIVKQRESVLLHRVGKGAGKDDFVSSGEGDGNLVVMIDELTVYMEAIEVDKLCLDVSVCYKCLQLV